MGIGSSGGVEDPHTLAGLNIDDGQADLIRDMAAVDPSSGTNPISFDASQYRALFVKAHQGDLG